MEPGGARPWFFAPLFVLSILAVSSAGAVTKLMLHSAPVSRAAWRLQLSAAILFPGLFWDWWNLEPACRRRAFHPRTLGILTASSVALAIHFGLWIWSLDFTSLPHSLLFVSMPPVVMVVISWLRCKPLSIGETCGTALATLGVAVMASFARVENDTEVTLVGDSAAFVAAIAFVIYVTAGGHLRAWMPLYLYTFPVMAGAAIFLSVTCTSIDGESTAEHISGPFEWLRKEYWALNLYLALGPGFVGHTGFNFLLRYTDPLVISMGITLEPVIGSVIGWVLNVSPPPGLPTCIGGAILVLGTIVVNCSNRKVHTAELDQAASLEDGLIADENLFSETSAR